MRCISSFIFLFLSLPVYLSFSNTRPCLHFVVPTLAFCTSFCLYLSICLYVYICLSLCIYLSISLPLSNLSLTALPFFFFFVYQDDAAAACAAIKDGRCDIDSGSIYMNSLLDGVKAGHCSMDDVRQALYDTLKLRFLLGLFDPVENTVYWHVPLSAVNTTESQVRTLF